LSGSSRIGVFGGAFDPPHRAHLALIEAALEQLQLDALHVIPTGEAWHKARKPTSAAHRLAMAKLAFGQMPRVVVDEREMRRGGPSYTIDTLRELRQELPQARLFLLIGEDQARSFGSWHENREIAALASIFVAGRAGGERSTGLFPSETGPLAGAGQLRMPAMETSATSIRELVAAGKSVAGLVPPAVARYIDQYQLYRST
jgi:nicotinate-nucleotide adenylyltransferase